MDLKLFKEVSRKYKVIFFDSYGVLRNYKGVFPGVREMLQSLEEDGIQYYILTNDASRSPKLLAQSFYDRGIPEITEEKIISSGMIAMDYMANKVSYGTIVYLGTEQSAHYVESIGLKTISIKDLDLKDIEDVSTLVLLDDEGFDWNKDLTKTINLLRKKSIPVIVANLDSTYPVNKEDVSIAIGGLAKLLEDLLKKTFMRFGKPDSQMFNFAYNYVAREKDINKSDILMVGDTLKTDIIGGNKFGIDTCLVLSGNVQAKNAELNIASSGIIPDYICDSVTT
jgi:HAD superfamily hydrolase (TIGR01450 family)